VLTYPKIIRHSHDSLKLEWNLNRQVLIKAWLHWTPTGQWWEIIFPICNTEKQQN